MWGAVVQWAYSSCISLLQPQGSAVQIPSSTFSFEECIVRGEEDEEEQEEEEEEELKRIKREGRGGRRRHSNQERQQEEKGFRFVFEDD